MKKALIIVTSLLSIAILIVAYNIISAQGGNYISMKNFDMPEDGEQMLSEPEEWDNIVFPQDQVVNVEIFINDDDFKDLCENADDKSFYPCTIIYNGVKLNNTGIRTKGNTSLKKVLNNNGTRFSFKVGFNHYVDQTLFGLESINLNNIFKDPSYMRDKLSYEMCDYLGLASPKTSYCNIYINGELHGLYLALQSVDDVFINTNFPDNNGDLYQPNRGGGSDLVYIDDDISSYAGLELKTNEDSSDGKDLINMLKTLDSGDNLESVLNTDDLLKYFAVCTAAVSLDSYAGGMYHNYYLYEEDGKFTLSPGILIFHLAVIVR